MSEDARGIPTHAYCWREVGGIEGRSTTRDPGAGKLFDAKVLSLSLEIPRWLGLLVQIRKLSATNLSEAINGSSAISFLCDRIISAPVALQDFPAVTAAPLLPRPDVSARTAPEVRRPICPPASEFCRPLQLPPPTESEDSGCHREPLRATLHSAHACSKRVDGYPSGMFASHRTYCLVDQTEAVLYGLLETLCCLGTGLAEFLYIAVDRLLML